MEMGARLQLRREVLKKSAVKRIIKQTLTAARDADASVSEVVTACRLTERLITEELYSLSFAEVADKAVAALDAAQEDLAALIDTGTGVLQQPGSED